mmetsp:Transcript_42280/g.94657  ORF Transcript_42280/g.94657 Transcript_42280/m.94657 type:complete len:366 (-) Transcript_42280:238-1335(-)
MLTDRRRGGLGAGARRNRPQYGAAADLPALSICRLESPEELLKKLRQHAEDPEMAEFTCPICWEPFWQPVRTVCGHAFCESCLLKSVLAQLGYDQPDVSCPMCRHPLHVEDVSADEALLKRIRLLVAEKSREAETQNRTHAGRLHRGLARSPATVSPSPSARALRCTGQPCTPCPTELPARASTAGQRTRPFPGWMRVAPEERPATSGACTSRSAFWASPPTFSVTSGGVWSGGCGGMEATPFQAGMVALNEDPMELTPLWPDWPLPSQQPVPPTSKSVVRTPREGEGGNARTGTEGFDRHAVSKPARSVMPRLAHKLRPCSQPGRGARTSRAHGAHGAHAVQHVLPESRRHPCGGVGSRFLTPA